MVHQVNQKGIYYRAKANGQIDWNGQQQFYALFSGSCWVTAKLSQCCIFDRIIEYLRSQRLPVFDVGEPNKTQTKWT